MTNALHSLASGLSISLLAACCAAQTPSYHTEVAAGSGTVTFVNDSAKPIEAFYVWQQCGPNGFGMRIHDFLSGIGVSSSIPGSTGRPGRETQYDVIDPGARYVAMPMSSQAPGCEVKVIGAVFTDGTFAGSEKAIARLQARRDGIASAVRFWRAQLKADSGETPAQESMLPRAEFRAKADLARSDEALKDKIIYSPVYSYWTGAWQVDDLVLRDLKHELQEHDWDEACRAVAHQIDAWQKKIDDDVAMKKLAATFPLPPEIGAREEP